MFVSLAAAAASPAAAHPRLPSPAGDGASLVVPAADLDWTGRAGRSRHSRADWHWRYRAAYTRWLHNEYVRAGYPVRHFDLLTHDWVFDCDCAGHYRCW
jgi:hypothetical protein